MAKQYLTVKDLAISENLVKLRKRTRLTQEDVAAKLQIMGVSITRSHLSRIEIGELNVPVSMLVALKTIFNCEYADFFEGLDKELLAIQKKLEEE